MIPLAPRLTAETKRSQMISIGPAVVTALQEYRAVVISLGNSRDPLPRREPCRMSVCAVLRSQAFFAVLLLALGIFIGRASGQGVAADDTNTTIHGTVIDSVTHHPIGRALVYSPDNRFASLTDSEGHFEFPWPRTGDESERGFVYSGLPRPRLGPTGNADLTFLMARRPGFLDDPNQSTRVAASPGGELTISLMPEALITGRVVRAGGEAALGIQVQIFSREVRDGIARWTQGTSVRANSGGEFRFAELPPGDYKVLTHEFRENDPAGTLPGGQALGYPPVYYPNATDFAAASTLHLSAGQTLQADMSLLLQPYYPVRIPVANAVPNAGISITVSPQGHRSPGYSLGYNGQKQRIDGGLPNGKYLVEARSYGPNSLIAQVNIAVAGAPFEGPAVVLTPASSIVVNVKEEFTSTTWNASGAISTAGRRFAMPKLRLDLSLSVEPADDDDFAQQRGGSLRTPSGPDDNSMVLEDLAPGRYWLRPRASRGYVASATMGAVDLLRQPFVIGLGATVPIEITLRDDSAEIEGTVAGVTTRTTAEGAANAGPPTASAYIYCVPLLDSPGQFRDLSTSDGKFDAQMIAPGTYRVMAFKNRQPDLPYRDPEAMRTYESKGQIVHLSAGEKASVQLQIVSGSE